VQIGLQRVNGRLTVSISRHKIGAPCGGGVAMDHKCFHHHAISVAAFLAQFSDFAAARAHGT
jgi:hypothetical protein